LRAAAFGLASRRAAGRGVQHLSWALSGPHTGLRVLAVEELGERAGEAVEVLLTRALRDEDAAVRRAAVHVAARKGAQSLLLDVLESEHDDTRLWAAHALACTGATDALDMLLEQLVTACPAGEAGRAAWIERSRLCLEAVAELGDPAALAAVRPLLSRQVPELYCEALRAFVQVCDEDDSGASQVVRDAMTDGSSRVRREAAIGLALLGSDESADQLACEQHDAREQALEAIPYVVALSNKRPELLAAYAAHENADVRRLAGLLTLLAHPTGTEGAFRWRRGLLSCRHQDTRVLAAHALARTFLPQEDEAYVHGALLQRGESLAPRRVARETTRALGALVAYGSPRLRARSARMVAILLEDDAQFERSWKQFEARFSPSIGEALARKNRREVEWARRVELAFSSELVSGVGGSGAVPRRTAAKRRGEGSRVVHVAAAISEVARPLLCVAYGDSANAVREAATEALDLLGLDPSRCGLADHEALGRALRSLPSSLPPEIAVVPAVQPDQPAAPITRQSPGASPSVANLAPILADPKLPHFSEPPASPADDTGRLDKSSIAPANVLARGRKRACLQGDGRAVRLAGDICARGSICDIVAFLGQSGWRGELCVVEQENVRTLYFDAGNVVGATSTAPGDRLGDVMIHFGAIDQAQQAQIETLMSEGRRFGQIAVQLGFVTQDRLFDLMAKQICCIVFGAFAAASGEFYFYDGFDDARLPTRHTLGSTQLLMQGLSQQDEAELYRAKIPSANHIPDALPDRKPPPAALQRVYELVDGKRSVAAIGRDTGLGAFEVTKQLYELVQNKHVRILEPPQRDFGEAHRLAAAQALQSIREELLAAALVDDLRERLLRSSAGKALECLGLTLADNGEIEIAMPMSRPNLEETPSRRGNESRVLHELVAAALLVAEGLLGATAESKLRQALTPQLNILRPQGPTLAEQSDRFEDSERPSQRFHIRMLGDVIKRPSGRP
ncbi:MAG: DUF4388 domain-containing protein, partial [Polyangiaceae bacterium]|nr:DUF4388 domain-containing protein [Polyangiaceae bacterium]